MFSFLSNRSLIFIIFIMIFTIFFNTSFAFGQKQNSENHIALFGNGSSSLFNDVFNKVKDSVVQIATEYPGPGSPNQLFNAGDHSQSPVKFGSGFVYDRSGFIITNYHVISSATSITVTFNDGNTYPAKLVGTDPYGDVSIIKLEGPIDENLIPVIFSNSSNLKVGDPVLAIGNPYGLDNTLTFGIVSQVGRLLPNSDLGYSIPNVIQTDAAINPGNSGGPLIDLNGNVVGMNTAIFSNTGAYTGVGFAIPSNDIMRVIPSLVKTGSYQHPWLGISGSKLTPNLSKLFGLSQNFKGVLVEDVVKNGPADKAGLKGMVIQGNRFGQQQILDKDILISLDNNPVTRIDDVISYLNNHKKVGDEITLTVNRNGKIINMIAKLSARPDTSIQNLPVQPPSSDTPNPYNPFPNFQLPKLPDLQLPKLPDLHLPKL